MRVVIRTRFRKPCSPGDRCDLGSFEMDPETRRRGIEARATRCGDLTPAPGALGTGSGPDVHAAFAAL